MNYQILAWVLATACFILFVGVCFLVDLFQHKRVECVDLTGKFLNVKSKLEFSREFEDKIGFLINTFIDQEQVDKVLSALAVEFWTACQQQICLQQRPWLEIETGLEEMRIKMAGMKENVIIRKKAFWDAHASAKVRGFVVRNSSQDYLPISTPQ